MGEIRPGASAMAEEYGEGKFITTDSVQIYDNQRAGQQDGSSSK